MSEHSVELLQGTVGPCRMFLKVRAPNKEGKVVEYSIEMLHPPAMAKRGWKKLVLKKVIL